MTQKSDQLSDSVEPGTLLDGRYEILALLGSGARSQVFRARHVHIGTEVAVKVVILSGDEAEAKARVELFRSEATIAGRIDHPNVVTVHDFGFAGGPNRPYLVMDLLDGTDLSSFLVWSGAIAPQVAAALFEPCLEALAIAHEAGITHGDLRPRNLFHARDDEGETLLVLLDFGRANAHDAGGACLAQYRAPEVSAGARVSPATDVYQAGLVLAEALSGKALVAEDESTALLQHRTGDLAIAEEVAEGPLGAVIVGATRIEPADRYPDARAMLEALREARLAAWPTALDSVSKSASDLAVAREAELSSKATLYAGRPKIDAENVEADVANQNAASDQSVPSPPSPQVATPAKVISLVGLLTVWLRAHPALGLGGAMIWFLLTCVGALWLVWPSSDAPGDSSAAEVGQGDERDESLRDASSTPTIETEAANWRAILASYDAITASAPNARFLRGPRAEATRFLGVYEDYQRALRLLDEGDTDAASKLLSAIPKDHPLRKRPSFEEALERANLAIIKKSIRKAKHAMMLKDWGLARKNIADVLHLDPDNVEALELKRDLGTRGRQGTGKAGASGKSSSNSKRGSTRRGNRSGGTPRGSGSRGAKRKGGSGFFRPSR